MKFGDDPQAIDFLLTFSYILVIINDESWHFETNWNGKIFIHYFLIKVAVALKEVLNTNGRLSNPTIILAEH